MAMELSEHLQKIKTDWDARCEERKLRAQPWLEHLRDQGEPDVCERGYCEGMTEWEGHPEHCPFETGSWEFELPCPHLAERRRVRSLRRLADMGFGVRYRSAHLEQIVSDVVREKVGGYCAGIEEAVRVGRGLLVTGGVGTGKTSVLALIAAATPEEKCRVTYRYAGDLFDELHKDEGDEAKYCDLLLLDDFGTEYAADWNITRFDSLMEYRYANRKAVCVTTNSAPQDLAKDPRWQRAVDRWRDMCEVVSMGTGSQRGKKA